MSQAGEGATPLVSSIFIILFITIIINIIVINVLIIVTPARGVKDEDNVLWHGGKVLRGDKVDEVTVNELNLVKI